MAKPMSITPIIVAMNDHAVIADLVNPAAAVNFDFSGFNTGHQWPWIKPAAGLLVWDPTGAGRITTGRQLFGPMTWQMLFRDGYEALSMLDRNHDGQLTGDELQSIALWQDKNGNAVSDAGEVVPLDQAGIIAIDLKANRDAAGVLNAPAGIHWRDGHTTASFDWVPESK